MIKLGTNILSQKVQRNLGRASTDLSKASERLSSGQRINRASDDAAGLAISMSLDKDRILARTAQRNVSDGISMVNILSSGLSSQKEILFRMTELAEQSANGTYSSAQREALQKEYGSLMDEFDRIGDSTEFNGVKLLRNSTPQTMNIMTGITGADSSLLALTAANSHRYAGVITQKSDTNESGLINSGDLDRYYDSVYSNESEEIEVAPRRDDFQNYSVVSYTDSLGRAGTANFLIHRIYNDFFQTSKFGGTPTISDIPSQQDFAGVARSKTGEIAYISGIVNPSSPTMNFTFSGSGATGSISLNLSGAVFESVDSGRREYRPSAIGFTNVLSRHQPRRSIDTVKNRIEDLSSLEGQYGALVSRLGVAHSLLSTSGENFAAASSRIKDADIATEAANSVRSGILQQAATSLLGQANQAPQIALSLLRGA